MKKFLLTLFILTSLSAFSSIPESTHLGCQLEAARDAGVFDDLTKFNISKADTNGLRILNAYSADIEGLTATCVDSDNEELICDYISSQGNKIQVILDYDSMTDDEITGDVYYGKFFRKSMTVNCDLLTF